MLRMINESLVLYKIETGTFQLNPELVNICDVIEQVVASLGNICESNQASIEIRFTGNNNRTRKCDALLLGHLQI